MSTPYRSSHISSRLARHEQKKLLRQTLVFGGLAVILILAFIFVILPQSVRFVAGLGGTSPSTNNDDTIPPQVPVLAAPPTATPSGTLNLSGVGEPQSEVVLVVNSSEQARQTVGNDGTFSIDAQLQDGDNQLNVYAVDGNKNESASSQTYTVIKDSEPPKLEVQEPQDGQRIETRKNQTLTIKGASDPDTRITVNGRLSFARADGSFSTTYQLQEGENKLTIQATDQAGNVSQKDLTVTFAF